VSEVYQELVTRFTADVSGLKASMSGLASDVSRFRSTTQSQLSGIESSFKSIERAAIAFGAALAIRGVTDFAKSIFNAGVQMQILQNRMTAAVGDAKISAEAMKFVRQEADTLGLNFQQAATSFANLAAATLRAGITFKETKDIFNAVSVAATTLHLSNQQVGNTFLALEEMASKGVVQLKELRRQLSNNIPGAFEIAAKAMNAPLDQFTKMIHDGKVITSDFLPKFADELVRTFGGNVVTASQSAQAAVNRFNNALFDLRVNAAQGGFLDEIVNSLTELTKLLKDPAVNEGLIDLASGLGKIASAAVQSAAGIALMVERLREWFKVGSESGGVGGGIAASIAAIMGGLPSSGRFGPQDKIVNQPLASSDMLGIALRGYGNYALGEKMKPSDTKGASARKSALEKLNSVESYSDDEGDKLKLQLEQHQKLIEDAYKKRAISKKKFDDEMSKVQLNYDKRMKDYVAKTFGSEIDKENNDYENRKKALEKALKDKLITTQKYQELLQKAERDHAKKMIELQNLETLDSRSMQREALDGFLNMQTSYQQKTLEQQGQSFRESISQAAQHNKLFFELEKATAIAQALLSARQSVVDAYKFGNAIGGPVLGTAFAGVAAAAQAANIAAIASTSFSGGGGVNAAGGGAASVDNAVNGNNTANTAVPQQKSVTINLVGKGLFSKNDIRDLIHEINDALSDGSTLNVAVAS
jgi:tape measure domain-containing protein